MFGIARLNTIAKVAQSAANVRVTNSTWTVSGGAFSSSSGKFGNSYTYAGGSDTITMGTTAAGQRQISNTQALTIEFWVLSTLTTNAVIFSTSAGDITIEYNSSQGNYKIFEAGNTLVNIANTTWTSNVWHHIVLQFSGSSTWSMWFNGSPQVTNNATVTGSSNAFSVGASGSSGGSVRIDEMRITAATKYTPGASFSVPTAAYTNETDTIGLFHCETSAPNLDDSPIVVPINYSAGTGGTVTTWTEGAINWKAHAFFAGTNTFTVTNVGETGYKMFGFLVAGGGGGGGKTTSTNGVGGGGGGGEVNSMGQLSIAAQSYTIVVGAGGTAGSVTTATRGGNGGNSSAFGTTVLGGGGGGNNTTGGPATAFTTYTGGGAGTASTATYTGGQGSTRNGGSALSATTTSQRAGGGGGGYNANGSNGTTSVGGAGGAGYTSTVANSVYGTAFGAGGGGGGATAGAGGNSGAGGGAGAVNGAGNAGIGYGCGGGGARTTSTTTALGGAGKEGIFIVYYQVA